MISDAQNIGGEGIAAISNPLAVIGGVPADDGPYTDIASYTTSPQGESHVFTYPDNKIVTVYDGAQIQMPDPGGVPPYTYKSSATSVATIDTTGRATFHNTGNVKLTMTDATGARWGAEFAPSLYMLDGPYISPYEDAQPWCESQGGRLPTRAELSHNGSGRFVGSLYGEWGSALRNGFTNYASGSLTSWTSDMQDPTLIYVVYLTNGQNITEHPASYATVQVAVLSKKPA